MLSLLAAAAVAAVPSMASGAPAFVADVRPLSSAVRDAMTPSVWRPGCPVGLGDLRRVRTPHWGFDGRVRRGVLVVHRDAVDDVVTVLRTLYRAKFPIRKMVPIQAYGGSDWRSIEDDNTSAFNCRVATGSSRWSQHAYGRAVDVNPIENPYVDRGGQIYHTASRPYVARTPVRPGMAVPGGVLVSAFATVGWGWGGSWTSVKDYQHFSATGG
jgi:hypothetical protein